MAKGKGAGGYDGRANLIPMNRRTEIEQKRIATAGGKASGKARRQKANFRRVLNQILTMPIPDDVTKQEMEAMGLDGTMQDMMLAGMVRKSLGEGMTSIEAAKFVAKYAGQSEKTELDERQQSADVSLKEQEAKLRAERAELEIEKLKAEIERLKSGKDSADDDMVLQFIDGMRGDSDDTADT